MNSSFARRWTVAVLTVLILGAGVLVLQMSESRAGPGLSSLCPGEPAVDAGSLDEAVLRSDIKQILRAQEQAWMRGDAKAWGEVFSRDSVFTNILGMRFEDRRSNVERHAQLFETVFGGSELTVCLVSIRALDSAHVQVDTVFEVTGHQELPPGIQNTREGELLTRRTMILERHDTDWLIQSAQGTAVQPVAVQD